MPIYKAKPVHLTAMPWAGYDRTRVLDWMGRESPAHMPEGCWLKQNEDPRITPSLMIKTRSGESECRPGDYVIAEPDGKGFYPCDEAVFEAKYELVEDAPDAD